MWQTTFLILRVALLGNCKTFQRLPVYQCFKRQLINVICIWATAYVNIDWGVIGGMLSAGLTRAAFLQGCCSSAWKCYHQIWPLAEYWYSVVLSVALSHIFSPLFLNSRWDFSPVLGTVQTILGACLATHPSKPTLYRSVPGCSPPMGSHKCTCKGGPTGLVCFRLNNEFSELINNFLSIKTLVLCACELLKPPNMTCWLQEWCLLSCRVTEAHPKYMFSFYSVWLGFAHRK